MALLKTKEEIPNSSLKAKPISNNSSPFLHFPLLPLLKIKSFTNKHDPIREKNKIPNKTLKAKPLLNNHSGFSIMGALVASAIGLVVITGITKLFVHMSAQLKTAEQKVQRINLNSLLGNYMNDPGHCKETLLPSAPQISTGNDSSLKQIKIKGGGTALDLVLEKNQLKTKYGMEGFTDIQLKCQETGGANACKKCSGPFPCPSVKWSLSLVSQTYVNQVPSFNRLLEKALVLTHTGPNDSDFECFLTAPPSTASCGDLKGTIEGYDSHGNKKCYYLCPKGKTRKDGSSCDCPTGYAWTGTQCVEKCQLTSTITSIPTIYQGLKVKGICSSLNTYFVPFAHSIFVPSLGFFVGNHILVSAFSLTSTDKPTLSRAALDTGKTVAGYDENGNRVSFKPCPSGQVWIGSQCAELCTAAKQIVTRSSGSPPLSLPGIKIKGKCRHLCYGGFQLMMSGGGGPLCFFVPRLKTWFLYTSDVFHPPSSIFNTSDTNHNTHPEQISRYLANEL